MPENVWRVTCGTDLQCDMKIWLLKWCVSEGRLIRLLANNGGYGTRRLYSWVLVCSKKNIFGLNVRNDLCLMHNSFDYLSIGRKFQFCGLYSMNFLECYG